MRAFAELAIIGLLGSVLLGLFVADGQTLIEIALTDAAPGALLIIVVALLMRTFWRMFSDAKTPILPVNSETGEPTWRDVLVTVALAPLAVLLLVAIYALFGATWRAAALFLDYAVQGQAWVQADWQQLVEHATWRFENPFVYLALCAIYIVWVVLEKLLVRPQKPDGQTNEGPQ